MRAIFATVLGCFLCFAQRSSAQLNAYCGALPPTVPIFVPHTSRCDQFVRCFGGSALEGVCPVGLHFNPSSQMCDLPEKVGCVDIGGIVDYTTVAPTERAPAVPCQAVGVCPIINSVDMTVILPHASDCALFCTCDNGIPRTGKCPPGLQFNAVLQVCDWPWKARCLRPVEIITSTTATESETDSPDSTEGN